MRELDRGDSASSRSVTQAVAIAVFLALVGIAMAIYLLSVRGSTGLHSELSQGTTVASATTLQPLMSCRPFDDKSLLPKPQQ